MEYSLPTKNNMPDLSDIDLQTAHTYLLNSLVGLNKGVSRDFDLYRKNLVRLVDKSIYEYCTVRELIELQIKDTNGSIYIIGIINHLENCINSLKRSLDLFEKIRRHKDAIPLKKEIAKYFSSLEDKVSNIRNAIEHADGDIQASKFTEGNPVAISVSDDSSVIQIFDHSISTNE